MVTTLKINGTTITVEGNGSVSFINNRLVVGGKTIEIGSSPEIIIEGNCGEIRCDCSVTVNGNVNGNIDCGGSCKCGDVSGSIDAGGSVTSGKVGGGIDAGGSVHCQR
jgi:hypothetical protein